MQHVSVGMCSLVAISNMILVNATRPSLRKNNQPISSFVFLSLISPNAMDL